MTEIVFGKDKPQEQKNTLIEQLQLDIKKLEAEKAKLAKEWEAMQNPTPLIPQLKELDRKIDVCNNSLLQLLRTDIL